MIKKGGDSTRNQLVELEREIRESPMEKYSSLLQLRVLDLGYLEDGDVGIGTFPDSKELRICCFTFFRVVQCRVAAS